MKSDLERAYDALSAKAVFYSTLWSYYDGDAPIKYVTDRVKEVFQTSFARFSFNWCSVVVNSEKERIHLRQFMSEDKAAQNQLNDLWRDTELDLDADDVTTAVLVCGEAFVFVWKTASGAVEAYYNDPRLCHVFYDDENPRIPSLAAKWWVGADKRRYLNLYYPERIEYYVSQGDSENVSSAKMLVPAEMPLADNPFGVIPIFHFRRERRVIKGALVDVIEPQDAINKLFSDMMVAAEFGAFAQRYVVSNANLKALKNAPNEIWTIPAGDGDGESTQVGQFNATNLDNYLTGMDKIANNIAIITRTPKHYFMSQGGDPSGEALIAMESPLNKKAQTTIDRLSPVWSQVAAFMLQLAGSSVPANAIRPVFERAETVQPLTRSQIRQTDVSAGLPLRTTLRREGWTDDEINALDAEPPDKQKLVDLAEKIADRVDDRTYLEIIAPAFAWDEAKINGIEAALRINREQQARNEARGFVEAIFPSPQQEQSPDPARVTNGT